VGTRLLSGDELVKPPSLHALAVLASHIIGVEFRSEYCTEIVEPIPLDVSLPTDKIRFPVERGGALDVICINSGKLVTATFVVSLASFAING
jgi:hypothetical protein